MCSACEVAFWQMCDVLGLTPEQVRIAMETGQFPSAPNPPAQFSCDAPAEAQPASNEPKP